MNVTCPSCGADMDLDVLFAHEDSRQAMATLASLTLPLAKRTLQYIRLFKPATRQMSHSRTVKLIEELLPDMQRRAITHNGRDWTADLETWGASFDRVLERRDIGKLALPLKSHGYLYEVIVGLADKSEGQAESALEAERRHHRAPGGAADPKPIATTFQPAVVAPVIVPRPEGPSAYALRVRAENEAKRRAGEGGTETSQGDVT